MPNCFSTTYIAPTGWHWTEESKRIPGLRRRMSRVMSPQGQIFKCKVESAANPQDTSKIGMLDELNGICHYEWQCSALHLAQPTNKIAGVSRLNFVSSDEPLMKRNGIPFSRLMISCYMDNIFTHIRKLCLFREDPVLWHSTWWADGIFLQIRKMDPSSE